MAVRELSGKPTPMAHFPDDRYQWLELHDGAEPYGYAAIAQRDDTLELHISLIRWGPRTRRHLAHDADWLKTHSRRLGIRRVTGIRINTDGQFDSRLFRFARLFGFSECYVLQTATLIVSH